MEFDGQTVPDLGVCQFNDITAIGSSFFPDVDSSAVQATAAEIKAHSAIESGNRVFMMFSPNSIIDRKSADAGWGSFATDP
jgi:hypothetical protein